MIRHFAKDAMRSALYYSGALGLFHRFRNCRTLTTFMFHRVLPANSKEFECAEREFTFSVEGFGRCLDFIKKHYKVVCLADLHRSMQSGQPLPDNAALITFDDGWRDTLQHAQPELKCRNMNAVLFVASEVLSLAHDRWWQDALVTVLHDPQARHLLLQELLQLVNDSGSSAPLSDRQLNAALATLPEKDRFEILARVHDLATLPRQMLTKDDLQYFERDCVELGAHGHTHAPLTDVKDPALELNQSYKAIQAFVATPITMSFPHGAYNAGLVEAAKQVGFYLVFTSDTTLTPTEKTLSQFSTIGRIHVPENRWTCRNGKIAAPLLATFLFFRKIAVST